MEIQEEFRKNSIDFSFLCDFRSDFSRGGQQLLKYNMAYSHYLENPSSGNLTEKTVVPIVNLCHFKSDATII